MLLPDVRRVSEQAKVVLVFERASKVPAPLRRGLQPLAYMPRPMSSRADVILGGRRRVRGRRSDLPLSAPWPYPSSASCFEVV